jgi:hypothetical protein
MSGNPGQYKDFNKTAADLLNKVFPKKTGANTWGIELELRPTANNTFGGKITSVGGVSTGEVSTEFVLPDFGITNKILFRTDRPTLEASWKVSDKIPIDGLSAKVHFDATDKSQTAGVSIAYEHRYATLNARVAVPISVQLLDFAKEISGQDTTAEVDLVVAHPDYKFVAGGQAKVSIPQAGERRLDESQVSLGYRSGKLFGASVSYTQKNDPKAAEARSVSAVFASQPADTLYVAQVDYAVGSKQTVATIGFSYPLNDGAVVKAKVNSQKQVGLAYSKQITAASKLDFGSLFQINTDKAVSVDAAFSANVRFTQ